MLKMKSINCYQKDDKKYVVVKLENGEVVFLNYNLVLYAMNNINKKKGDN